MSAGEAREALLEDFWDKETHIEDFGHDLDALIAAVRAEYEPLLHEALHALREEISLHPYDADVPTGVLAARDRIRAALERET